MFGVATVLGVGALCFVAGLVAALIFIMTAERLAREDGARLRAVAELEEVNADGPAPRPPGRLGTTAKRARTGGSCIKPRRPLPSAAPAKSGSPPGSLRGPQRAPNTPSSRGCAGLKRRTCATTCAESGATSLIANGARRASTPNTARTTIDDPTRDPEATPDSFAPNGRRGAGRAQLRLARGLDVDCTPGFRAAPRPSIGSQWAPLELNLL